MQFKVPQFLDIEDKIFGPFTFSEFVYLAGGAGLCYVLYKALGLLLGFLPIAAVAGLAIALVFYKPNGKPFIDMIESGLKYTLQSKLYVWQQKTGSKKAVTTTQTTVQNKKPVSAPTPNPAKLSGSKLQDLAWSLDVLDIKEKENGN
ncbi:MAG: PrgI family protein [Candidatus Paceibacterota bacterium]